MDQNLQPQCQVMLGNHSFSLTKSSRTVEELKDFISISLNLPPERFYLLSNGKKLATHLLPASPIHIVFRTLGGKGGFGSMLRAIGAQIEKTTNREACRDLSGRRLRDINEEQRLKKWVAQQADREKEAKERKKKKLEKMLEEPKYEFKDADYDKERSALPEKIEDAVLKGLEASCSGTKRKAEDTKTVKKKKPKLWIDSELDEDLSTSSEDDEGEQSSGESSSKSDKVVEKLGATMNCNNEEAAEKLVVEGLGATTDCDNEEVAEKEDATNVKPS